ncbi:MAG: insulinase family protein, partial [Verrucomicrobiaceae bacterium]
TEQRLTLTILDPLDSPAPARTAKVARIREEITVHTLSNGLRLALVPDRRVPLIHLQAVVRGGLPSETAETNGLSQLLVSTLPKGTATRSAQEIAVTLESLGASISAATGNNSFLVQAAGLAPDLATISDVFAEVIISPSLPEDAIHREKASQLASLEEALQDPLHTGLTTLRAAIFCGTGYGLDSLGSVESLTALDRSALVAHHARHFNAANVIVTLCGDFDSGEALALLSGKFASLPGGQPWSPPASDLAPGESLTRHLPKKQAVLAIGFPGTTVSGEDRFALAMIQEYVSDMAGPLFTRIREELGLAYQVGGTQFLGYDAGLFTFYVATSPEQADLALREILAEIRKIAAHGIPEEAFDHVRSTVLSALAIQQQSIASTARHVALELLFGHPADQHRRLAEEYNALTPEAVKEIAARVFSIEPTVVTVLPESNEEA